MNFKRLDKEDWDNPDFRNPRWRILEVIHDTDQVERVMWYCYRFPYLFIKDFSEYSEDLIHEICLVFLTSGKEEFDDKDISRICRRTVSRFIAKTIMTLSGYGSFKSWLNRRNTLRNEYKERADFSSTEYEESIRMMERETYSQSIMNEIRLHLENYNSKYTKIALDYIDGFTYEEISSKYSISKRDVSINLVKARLYVNEFVGFRDWIIVKRPKNPLKNKSYIWEIN